MIRYLIGWGLSLAALVCALLFIGCPGDENEEINVDNNADTSVTAHPEAVSVAKGAQYQFSASVVSTGEDGASTTTVLSNDEFLWNILEKDRENGTGISSDGMLSVDKKEKLERLTVIATYKSNQTKYGLSHISVYGDAEVTHVEMIPSSVTIKKGGTQTFAVNVTGTFSPTQQVTWSIAEKERGENTSINADGVLTVDIAEPLTSLTVLATSVADTSKSGTALVTVDNSSVVVSGVYITPTAIRVGKGSYGFFDAQVLGSGYPSQTVVWSIVEQANSLTTIDSDGCLYVSPNETLETLTVKAVSSLNPSKFATAEVFAAPGGNNILVTKVRASPASLTMARGSYYDFTAVVEGEGNIPLDVAWSVVETDTNPGTGITCDGRLVVNTAEPNSTLQVRATSLANTNIYDTVTVLLVGGTGGGKVTSVSIEPESATVPKASYYDFSAQVIGENSPSESVVWSIVETSRHPGTNIMQDGRLVVSKDETLDTLTVKAVSTVDASKTASAKVTVAPSEIPVWGAVTGVTVEPASGSVVQGQSMSFTATLTGTGEISQVVSWVIDAVDGEVSNPGTGITSGGLLVVAEDEQRTTLTVRARSALDSSQSGTAQVTVMTKAASSVSAVTLTPAQTLVTKGGTADFTALVSGTSSPSQTVLWSIETVGVNIKTVISSTGRLIVAEDEALSSLSIRATSVQDSSKYGVSSVSLVGTPPPAVTSVAITPESAIIDRGKTAFFTVSVIALNGASSDVRWSIVESGKKQATIVSSSGQVLISMEEPLTTLTIKAASYEDPSKYATAVVYVRGVDTVSVNSPSTPLIRGGSYAFTATVTGTEEPDTSVVWSIEDTGLAAGTSISADGVLTVASVEPHTTLTICATSSVEPLKFGTALVTLEDPVNVSPITGVIVTPGTATVAKGGVQNFSATVRGTGAVSQAVLWSITTANISALTGITDSGQLIVAANETQSTLVIRATSLENTLIHADAVVTVSP